MSDTPDIPESPSPPAAPPAKPGHALYAAADLPAETIERGRRAVEIYERTVTHNPFIRKECLKDGAPHTQQQRFLLHVETQEVFFGGATGGGKSFALLLAALQFVQTPGYNALLLRQSFRDLNQPGALVPVSKEWLSVFEKDGVKWNERDRRWSFPSGATLTFGYLDRPDDVYQYQGAAFSFIGFDELSQFDESSYLYLFSRLRSKTDIGVPLRMRAASNPGGKGAAWVKERFIDPKTRKPGVIFIPSKLKDNPSLDYDTYVKSMSNLDPITRAQLLDGDWEASQDGRFKMAWFRGRFTFNGQAFHLHNGNMEVGKGILPNRCPVFVTVDLAASQKTSADYTVFLACAQTPWKQLLVLNMERDRIPVEQIPTRLRAFCNRVRDFYGIPVTWAGVEANGMQIGIATQCRLLDGMPPVKYLTPANQDKLARATPAIIAAEQGQIFVPLNNPAWLEAFLFELVQFTGNPKNDSHDDCVDCLSYAVGNAGFVNYEAPSFLNRSDQSGRSSAAGGDPRQMDGASRLFKRAGRMRRLFGNG